LKEAAPFTAPLNDLLCICAVGQVGATWERYRQDSERRLAKLQKSQSGHSVKIVLVYTPELLVGSSSLSGRASLPTAALQPGIVVHGSRLPILEKILRKSSHPSRPSITARHSAFVVLCEPIPQTVPDRSLAESISQFQERKETFPCSHASLSSFR